MAANTDKHLTPAVIDRFLAYWDDRGNWNDMPLVGGNVGGDAADKGYIVNMKKAGLITTSEERERVNGKITVTAWISFTEAGEALAQKLTEERAATAKPEPTIQLDNLYTPATKTISLNQGAVQVTIAIEASGAMTVIIPPAGLQRYASWRDAHTDMANWWTGNQLALCRKWITLLARG